MERTLGLHIEVWLLAEQIVLPGTVSGHSRFDCRSLMCLMSCATRRVRKERVKLAKCVEALWHLTDHMHLVLVGGPAIKFVLSSARRVVTSVFKQERQNLERQLVEASRLADESRAAAKRAEARAATLMEEAGALTARIAALESDLMTECAATAAALQASPDEVERQVAEAVAGRQTSHDFY